MIKQKEEGEKRHHACVDAEGMFMRGFQVQIGHDGNKNCNVVEESYSTGMRRYRIKDEAEVEWKSWNTVRKDESIRHIHNRP